MGKTLDKSRHYGQICGGSGIAVYEQDGVLFDGAGNEVGTHANFDVQVPEEGPSKDDLTKENEDLKANQAKLLEQNTALGQQMAAMQMQMAQLLTNQQNAQQPASGETAATDASDGGKKK